MNAIPFVKSVVLENYKSIARCDVSLGPLTVLVGPNGSGKSNFVDGLRFVADALTHPEIPATGVGEPAVNLIAPAISNAIFDATGVRRQDASVASGQTVARSDGCSAIDVAGHLERASHE
jgi:recombinational DNA repair ATPase RecF